jgi:sn-glycerol 3-phosphate transport system substrate-binding protein
MLLPSVAVFALFVFWPLGRTPSVASAGCLLGVMPQARKASEDGLEVVIVGSKPVAHAMKDAAASVQAAIDRYHKSFG